MYCPHAEMHCVEVHHAEEHQWGTRTNGWQARIELRTQGCFLPPAQDQSHWARQQLLQELLRKVLRITVPIHSSSICQRHMLGRL